MQREFSVIGKHVTQKDGLARVTGTAKYYSDVYLKGMLTAKMLRSPYPQAIITSLDTTEAEKLPGVELILTYKNCPKVFRPDVHYVGEHVAAVIAKDEDIAHEAIQLIKVEYEQKPYVLSLEDAMKPEAPSVFEGQPNVHTWELSYYLSDPDPKTGLWRKKEIADFHGFGDVEQGFKEADVIVEQKNIKYSYAKSPAMNPRGSVVDYDGERLTVYTHSQAIHHGKAVLAEVLGIDAASINYVSPFTGSSFGGKIAEVSDINHPSHYIPIAAFAALELSKPVRCAYTREEEMLCGWSRGALMNLKIGFTKDGRLHVMDMESWAELGSGGDKWPVKNIINATGTVLYARNCKHLRGKMHYVWTNRFLSCGWQGYGVPEGHFAVETTMDKAAEILGIDPIELRKMNHFRMGDIDSSYDPLTYKAAFLGASNISECLDKGAESVGWKEKWKPPSEKTERIRSGIGVAIFCMMAGKPGTGNDTASMVKVYRDGTLSLYCALADLGQGQHTVQCQVAAEAFGVPYESVKLVCHDTDSTPYACMSASSCGTWMQGWATHGAAMDAKQKVLKLAAGIWSCSPDELDIKNGSIIKIADPSDTMTFAEAFGPINIYGGHHYIEGYYHFHAPPESSIPVPEVKKGGIYLPKERGAQFVSLDVDTETGAIFNVKVVHAQDVGKALNPKVVAGQFLNARHGLENAILGSDCIVDKKSGRLLNCRWEDYRHATISDFEIEPIILEIPGDPTHPFGASACGEGVACPSLAAVSNAIYNAIGVRLLETPFTPEKILKALGKIPERK